MAEVVLARIDDRFIHGQVVTKWLQHVGGCDEILIADDTMDKDPFLQSVMAMAAPPGINLRVEGVDRAIAHLLSSDPGRGPRILLLMRGPETALSLLKGGVPLRQLNVGSMGAAPDRRRLYREISASDEEVALLQEIEAHGVPVRLQVVPDSDRGSSLETLLKQRRGAKRNRVTPKSAK
ncbi:MAG: PTS system mannose/fructose/N-acetylgalactosamine-transporter subunit IIB [Anaerolineae bacterium]